MQTSYKHTVICKSSNIPGLFWNFLDFLNKKLSSTGKDLNMMLFCKFSAKMLSAVFILEDKILSVP